MATMGIQAMMYFHINTSAYLFEVSAMIHSLTFSFDREKYCSLGGEGSDGLGLFAQRLEFAEFLQGLLFDLRLEERAEYEHQQARY
jgi:hypothetical protein